MGKLRPRGKYVAQSHLNCLGPATAELGGAAAQSTFLHSEERASFSSPSRKKAQSLRQAGLACFVHFIFAIREAKAIRPFSFCVYGDVILCTSISQSLRDGEGGQEETPEEGKDPRCLLTC